MKFKVLAAFQVETEKAGTIKLTAGQTVELSPAKALRLLEAGKISPVERVAYRVFSEVLQSHLWVVYGPEDMHAIRTHGISEPVYSAEEIKKLKGASKEDLRTIQEVKTAFPASVVEDIER
jgi:hypothetical protein